MVLQSSGILLLFDLRRKVRPRLALPKFYRGCRAPLRGTSPSLNTMLSEWAESLKEHDRRMMRRDGLWLLLPRPLSRQDEAVALHLDPTAFGALPLSFLVVDVTPQFFHLNLATFARHCSDDRIPWSWGRSGAAGRPPPKRAGHHYRKIREGRPDRAVLPSRNCLRHVPAVVTNAIEMTCASTSAVSVAHSIQVRNPVQRFSRACPATGRALTYPPCPP